MMLGSLDGEDRKKIARMLAADRQAADLLMDYLRGEYSNFCGKLVTEHDVQSIYRCQGAAGAMLDLQQVLQEAIDLLRGETD